ncbi:MAG TPA: hypothetical protein VKY74_10840 [Chloroflexia bacterium]|nr:hypothetical protein [Chloroflexia bacterium]
MKVALWLGLLALALLAAAYTSRGRAGLFAGTFILYVFMISIIYWTVIALAAESG